VALSLQPDTIVDVRVINGPAAIVDEGNWVMVPPRSPPWQR
jgi:hypothetical protein